MLTIAAACVADLLQSALPLIDEETLTPQWYAIQLEGTNVFGILDFSEGEEGRSVLVHLSSIELDLTLILYFFFFRR